MGEAAGRVGARCILILVVSVCGVVCYSCKFIDYVRALFLHVLCISSMFYIYLCVHISMYALYCVRLF